MRVLLTLTAVLGAALAGRADSAPPQGGPPPEERIAALKQSLQESQKQLRQYEWIETTIMSLKGEEKSRKQQRCYYGADGKIQKLPVGEAAPPPQDTGRRRGGRIKQAVVENKTEELQEYMQRAVGLVHQYVPPSPDGIEKAKKAGTVAARPLPAGHLRLELTNYLKPGDNMALDLDTATNRLLSVTVSSYLDKPEDAVALAVQFAALADGTSYTAQTTLDAPAKKVRVVVQNSGHRPMGR
jgi:hypothetical protein